MLAAWFDLIDVSPGGTGTLLPVPVSVWAIILLPFWLFFPGLQDAGSDRRRRVKRHTGSRAVRLPR